MFILFAIGLVMAAVGRIGGWYVDAALGGRINRTLGKWIASWVFAGGTAFISIAAFRTAFGSVYATGEASVVIFPTFYAIGMLVGLLSFIIVIKAVVDLVTSLRTRAPVG